METVTDKDARSRLELNLLVTRKLTRFSRAKALRRQRFRNRKDRNSIDGDDPEPLRGEEEQEEEFEEEAVPEEEEAEEEPAVGEEVTAGEEEQVEEEEEEMAGIADTVGDFFKRLWDAQSLIDARIRREEKRLAVTVFF